MTRNRFFIYALTLFSVHAMYGQARFKVPITLRSGSIVQTLQIGVHGDGPGGTLQDNTTGVDFDSTFGDYREVSLPPAPPPPYAFDARLVQQQPRVSFLNLAVSGLMRNPVLLSRRQFALSAASLAAAGLLRRVDRLSDAYQVGGPVDSADGIATRSGYEVGFALVFNVSPEFLEVARKGVTTKKE